VFRDKLIYDPLLKGLTAKLRGTHLTVVYFLKGVGDNLGPSLSSKAITPTVVLDDYTLTYSFVLLD
jgi:hypothetical protein